MLSPPRGERLVKGIAVEGTALIAREQAAVLRQRGYSEEFIAHAQAFLHDPGISIVTEARLATETVAVHAMHDPTEGGLATGLHEMAQAAGAGIWIDRDAVVVYPESAALCAEFGLDPLGTIASGALLIAVAQEQAPALLRAYEGANVRCARIGRVTPAEAGLTMKSGAVTLDLPRFDQDEIARLFQ